MFLPENIDLTNSENFILTIRLTSVSFEFTIHCPTDNNVFYYWDTTFSDRLSYSENIQKIFFDFNLFTQKFKRTIVINVSEKYTIVPDEYYDKKKAEQFYFFNVMSDAESSIVLDNKIEPLNINLLFDMDDDLHSFFSRSLLNPIFESHATNLISYFESYKKDLPYKYCFINFDKSLIDIITFNKDKLLSATTLQKRNDLDLTYLIYNYFLSISFDQLGDQLLITGDLSSQNEIIDSLKKVSKNVEIIEIDSYPTIPKDELKTIPSDLLIKLCE